MVWFKVDDGLTSSRKWLSIPKKHRFEAVGVWTWAGSWSARHDTCGDVPDFVLRALGIPDRLTAVLVTAGLWERTDEGIHFVHWRKHQDGDYRRNIRRSVREEVMDRDGRKCVECDATEDLSLDHIIRYRDDGPDTADNLRVLCMPCNLRRG